MPSSWLTFILTLDEPLVLRGEAPQGLDPGWQHAPGQVLTTCLAGLAPRAAAVEMSGRQSGVQLALDPLAAPAVLGVPAAELGPGDDAAAVLGRTADRLREQLADASTPERQAAVLQGWLDGRRDRRREVRAEVARAWRLIQTRRGDCRVGDIAVAVGLSPRQLRMLMRRDLGVGPKQACRLARLDHAVERIVTGADTTLAATAHLAGYADHSHLDAEFAAMVGCAPGAWLAEERRNIQDGGHRDRAESDHAR